MSGFLSQLAGFETVFFLLILLAAATVYIFKELKEKEQLKKLLQSALSLKANPSQEIKIQPQPALNQVYLKENFTSDNPRSLAGNPIYKIVITGGPCGGKSTSLSKIKKDLTEKGFRVLSVPQIPTLVVQAGGMILMSKFSMEERIKFQSMLIRFQMYAEDYFTRLAEMSKSPSIILCDRGTVDPAAYVSKQEFQAIMDEEGWSWTTLRDKRYDRVIHLVTAAEGAEQFYTLENNNARSQGLQVARNLDHKTLNSWTGHPHITVCPNVPGQSFDKKVDTAIRAVYKTVGLQVQRNRYEKLLISEPKFPENIKVEVSQVQEIFLTNEDARWSEDKIKRRGQNNSFTYQRKYRCNKNKQGDYPQEIRVPITSLQYVKLREEKADSRYKITNRQRIQFIVGSTYYSIDVWKNMFGQQDIYILRFANPDQADTKILIPPFIQIREDIRSNPKYQLKSIALA